MSRTTSPEQEDRLREYVRQGLSGAEVSDREGIGLIDSSYTNKRLKRLAEEMGITRERKNIVKYSVPYGLTNDSKDMRFRLAYRLTDLINKYGKDEVARMTGVSTVRQNDARKGDKGKPPFHNWTLAQIERTARALGVPFAEFLEDITLGYRKDTQWVQKRPDQL